MEVLLLGLAVAIVGALAGVVGPLVTVKITAKERRADKVQQYEREDEVAARAAATSTALVEVTQKVADKVDIVHTLTNSAYTAALQATLDSTRRELILLQRAANGDATEEEAAAIVSAQDSIVAQEAVLAERHRSDAEAQAQISAQAAMAKAAIDSAHAAAAVINGGTGPGG